MVAKLVLALAVVVIIVAIATALAFQYFNKQAARKHEKEMLRERRDAELLTEDADWIDRELERESR